MIFSFEKGMMQKEKYRKETEENKMKTDGILFDLDGTLWDAVEGILAAWNQVIAAHSDLRGPLEYSELQGYMGLPMDEIARRMFPMCPETQQQRLLEECCQVEHEVLEKRGGLKVSACDAYLNIVGGLSLDEPAADLAAVIALASSYLDRPVPSDLVAIGEVGLTGELRSVNQLGQRVSEIQRLGFRRCVVPAHRAGTIKAPTGLTVIPARNIGEAIRAALRPAE